MKTKILIFIATLFLVPLYAQEVKFGVKAGFNLFIITGDEIETPGLKAGIHAGGVAEFKLSDNFSIQPELLYSMQGGNDAYTEEGIKFEETAKYNYLNLPVMAKYYVFEGLSIEAGPYASYLLSAEYVQEASFGGETESNTEDVRDVMKSMDFGISGGIGYRMNSGLFLQARFNVGMANIADYDGGDQYNEGFQVSAGYMF